MYFRQGALTKNFCHAYSRLWLLRRWGLSESVIKGKIYDKNLFTNNVEWNPIKLWKMRSADVKAYMKQEIK